eukprot:m.166132 g.166132  ORF g.166132 m.166132 type:complete len:460 (+) comp12654_c0_seq1:46-1425(+)
MAALQRIVRTAAPRATRSLASLAEVDPAIPAPEFSAPAWESVKATRLANGVTVVSDDALSPVSSVSVVVAAGSARDPAGALGTSALMRAMAFQASETTTAFRRLRECELRGTSLDCTGDRETISYSADFLRDDAGTAVTMLSDAVLKQAFRPWDVKDIKSHLLSGGEDASMTDSVLDAVHSGAFRAGGLGNSVFADSYRLPAISADTLTNFAESLFTGNNITVVGSDVPHDQLVEMATEAFGDVACIDDTTPAAKYVGGFETRIGTGLGATAFALGFEGVGRGSPDVATAAVLEKLLFGTGFSSIPYGSGNGTNKVISALATAAGDAHLESFNHTYDGTGLLGATIVVDGAASRAAVTGFTAAVKAVLAGGFTAEDVGRAKAQAAMDVLEMTSAERAAFYATHSLGGGQPVSPEAFAAAIQDVTADKVKALAAKVGASKPVTVATGFVDDVPYADELGL